MARQGRSAATGRLYLRQAMPYRQRRRLALFQFLSLHGRRIEIRGLARRAGGPPILFAELGRRRTPPIDPAGRWYYIAAISSERVSSMLILVNDKPRADITFVAPKRRAT